MHPTRQRRIPVSPVFAAALAAMLAAPPAGAQQQRPAPGATANEAWFRPEADPAELRKILREDDLAPRWIYHDLDAARAEAQRTGKPILAMLKCVPCGSAPQFDDAVSSADSPLAALLDQFVCVRVVKMNGVNRHLFDFDRDVPLVAMFLGADGTVYGRYGTRPLRSRVDLPRHTVPSFGKSLERALALHAGRPANDTALAAKRMPAQGTPWTDDLPTLDASHNPPDLKNCIHCHMVGEAALGMAMRQRPLVLRDVWPFPLPDQVGLRLDPADGLRVHAVTPDSPAARAGVRPGDELVRLNGQPLVSEADVSWALHHLQDDARPILAVRRGQQIVDLPVTLSGDWRKGRTDNRASLGPLRPDLFLRRDPHHADNKLVPPGRMALTILYPRRRAAQAGVRQGDLLIAVDDRTDLLTEADFLKYLRLDRANAPTASLRILRKAQEITLQLPLQ